MTRLSDQQRRAQFGPPGSKLTTLKTPWGISVRIHPAIAAPFSAACNEAEQTVAWRPQRIDSFANRAIRGSTTTSLHAYGLACDFFATPPNVAPPGGVWTPDNAVPDDFAACFERRGFTWGATFHRVDIPHIEWAGAPPTFATPGEPARRTRRRPTMLLVHVTGDPAVHLYFGPKGGHVGIEDPADLKAIADAGVPEITVSAATWAVWAA